VQPPAETDRQEVARFFAGLNCARWSQAITTEDSAGTAICDTDPLKLHYDYCLARIGKGSWEQFWAGVGACRRVISCEHLGMADLIVCELPDDSTLYRHRRSDASRARRNFALHRDLGPALGDWYRTLDGLDPGRVAWGFPSVLPQRETRPRFDLHLFDEWMRALPGSSRRADADVRA
jgi:hypothetical protein